MTTDLVSDLVIGSGATGFACALGIIARGGHPVVMDFGAHAIGSRAGFAGTSAAAVKGVDQDRDQVFAYPRSMVAAADGRHLPLSSARGGLSSIWGAGVLVRDPEELAQFGPAEDGVRAGYDALLDAMAVVGRPDDTSRRFPWPADLSAAPQSARFHHVVSRLQQGAAGGPLFGYPRLALDLNASSGCIRCGQCLSGCPSHLFFESRRAIGDLVAAGTASWRTGPALALEACDAGMGVRVPSGRVVAERIHLAAGPVATAALLQRSGLAPSTLVLEDSAVFYTAFLNSRGPVDDVYEYASSHLVAFADRTGARDFQLAVYEANPEYRSRIRQLAPAAPSALIPDWALRRINAGIGFLPPAVSGRLVVRSGPGMRAWVSRRRHPGTKQAARAAIRAVGRPLRAQGIFPVPGAVIVPPPGSGYHVGASLPVGGGLVDFRGRLRDAPSVHIADASSLPHVWAGSHTFTAMANAYRIAFGACE